MPTLGPGPQAAQPPALEPVDPVDWSKFAYAQYATNSEYLCNSVMLFDTLHRLGSKAERLLMYPSHMLDPEAREAADLNGRLLIKARDQYGVILSPISVLHGTKKDGAPPPLPSWAGSDESHHSSPFQAHR